MTEPITARPWRLPRPPKKILAVRLQAHGDVVITLPYLQSLKERLPETRIDFLTREEVSDIPRNLELFGRVFAIAGGRNFKMQSFHALRLLPKLWMQRYEAVIDLQRNPLSRALRKALNPPCWSEFDRFSPLSAGERTRRAIEAAGLGGTGISPLKLKNASRGLEILRAGGREPGCRLIVLNPGGFFPSRNWPLDNYREFARLWLKDADEKTQFLILGVGALAEKARYLKQHLGDALLNLVGKTTPAEALAILRHADLALTEDSGLMHMAWAAGIPTLALFGSSRSDWSAPQGEFSRCLNSADLPCGECMEAQCRFGDVRCLSRFTPAFVFEKARELLERKSRRFSVGK